MKVIKTILFMSILVTVTNAQNIYSLKLPSPQIGWDSLQTKFVYPDLAARAGLWGAYEARLEIDSIGKMNKCEITSAYNNHKLNSIDSVFTYMIIDRLHGIKWNPGLRGDKPVTMNITIPLVFYFMEGRYTAPTFLIKTKPVYIN